MQKSTKIVAKSTKTRPKNIKNCLKINKKSSQIGSQGRAKVNKKYQKIDETPSKNNKKLKKIVQNRTPGTILEGSGGILGHLGASWEHLGPSWGFHGGILGASRGISWPLGGIWGPSWANLRASWRHLEVSWVLLGASWGPLLGGWRDLVGSSWLQVGPSRLKWASTWPKLAPWNQIEAILLKEVISADILQTSGFDFLMIFHDFSCPEPSIFDELLERNAYFWISCIFMTMPKNPAPATSWPPLKKSQNGVFWVQDGPI